MKTETKISAIAYDLQLKDLRTGEHLTDRIVLERSWLDVLNKMGISDYDLITRSYNNRGYYVLKVETRKKVTLIVDMEKLYAQQATQEEGISLA